MLKNSRVENNFSLTDGHDELPYSIYFHYLDFSEPICDRLLRSLRVATFKSLRLPYHLIMVIETLSQEKSVYYQKV